MTDLLLLVLLGLVLQNVDFLAFSVLQHLTGNSSTGNRGGSCLEACIGRERHDVEFDLGVLLRIQLLDEDDVLLVDLVLLSACRDNSKHEKHLFL